MRKANQEKMINSEKPREAINPLTGRTPSEDAEIARAVVSDPKGEPIVHLDFERGSFEGWSTRRLTNKKSALIQSEYARIGNKSCRFTLTKEDHISQGRRAELRDWYNAPFERTTWYGFSTLIPEDFTPPAGVGIVLAQWHDQAELGDPSGKPPLAIRYRNGNLLFTGAYAKVASPDPEKRYKFHHINNIEKGAWHDFIIRAFWSTKTDGELEVILNGQSLFSFKGALGYKNQIKGPYFKLGLYASDDIEEPLTLYHDNYSRAHSRADVDPSKTHTG